MIQEPSIFRQKAIRPDHGNERPLLPRFVSPAAFVCLWILTALLVAGGLAAWSTSVRSRTSGVAVAIDSRTLVAFLPSSSQSHLRVGQFMQVIPADGGGETLDLPINRIEPDTINPEAIRRRYKLDVSAAQAITGPAVVAVARRESTAGRVYRVTVDGGSRTAFSLFPLVGRGLEARP